MIILSCSGSQTDVSRGDTLPRSGRERDSQRGGGGGEGLSRQGVVIAAPLPPQPRGKSTEENKERQQLIVEGGVDACERVSAGCFLTV